ncbi:hypothetical protein [Streptomyces bauhiniae]
MLLDIIMRFLSGACITPWREELNVLFVQGASVTAVVRGSLGEPVILLAGESCPGMLDTRWIDVIRAAAVVLDATELQCLWVAMCTLSMRAPDSLVASDQNVLALYKVPSA